MARGAANKPGNVLIVVVFALVTLLGITLRNKKIERIGEAAQTTAFSSVTPSTTPAGQALSDSVEASASATLPRPTDGQATPALEVPLSQSDDLSGSLWKAVFYTALLLGAILGAAMMFKKYGGDRFRQTSSPDIEIVGRKYLNPKQSIAIVKVRNKELLLGITDQSIQLLDRLDSDET